MKTKPMDAPTRPYSAGEFSIDGTREWCSGRVHAVADCQSETLWIGAYPVVDVWEIAEGFIWRSEHFGCGGYVSRDVGTYEDAKSYAEAAVRARTQKAADEAKAQR